MPQRCHREMNFENISPRQVPENSCRALEESEDAGSPLESEGDAVELKGVTVMITRFDHRF